MRDLRSIREGWDQVEIQEARLLRQMSVQESVGYLLALYRAERMAYLEELQARLLTLEKWKLSTDQFRSSCSQGRRSRSAPPKI